MADALHFARSLYAPEAVEETARAFGHLAKLTVTKHEDDVELSISEPDADLADVLADEIANHVLALTVRGRR